MLQIPGERLLERQRRAEVARWFAAMAFMEIQKNLDRATQDIAEAHADGLVAQEKADRARTRCDELSERDADLFAQSRNHIALSKKLLQRER
jgi:hypothetical protein